MSSPIKMLANYQFDINENKGSLLFTLQTVAKYKYIGFTLPEAPKPEDYVNAFNKALDAFSEHLATTPADTPLKLTSEA